MSELLTDDTKAIILLCGRFGDTRSEKPLSLKEYSALVEWLVRANMRPGDLLRNDLITETAMAADIDERRMERLLGRGVQLGFAVEEWQRQGIWVISRSDSAYPQRYKTHFKRQAPPLIYGVGDKTLLAGGGLGIVGSRNLDSEAARFTTGVAELCAQNGLTVVSGGARGVDQISMDSSLRAGGKAIGVLSDSLLKKSLHRDSRQALSDGVLLLISPYHPNAPFSVGNAMGRNKLVYAMADFGLVVSAEYKKGGTWNGAVEELKRDNPRPIFVRDNHDVPFGNTKLLEIGALRWPDVIGQGHNLVEQLEKQVVSQSRIEAESQGILEFRSAENREVKESDKDENLSQSHSPKECLSDQLGPSPLETKRAKTVYDAVLPLILEQLVDPASPDELSSSLQVNKTQLGIWLKRAVEQNLVCKLSRPVRYQTLK